MAQQGEELFGWLFGSMGGGGGREGQEEKELDGLASQQREEGFVGWINGLMGGRGIWTD
jgi:hypothetical protein